MAVPLFADRYERIEELGRGNFGFVWRANDHNQRMEVALKLFKSGSPTIHAYREASMLTALAGKHVLQVFNADVASDVPYVSTRIAEQGSAEDVLKDRNPLGVSPAVAINWTRHLLVGLQSCHTRGLLHRDIKPANLFLDRPDWALLGDFGLACPLNAAGVAPSAGTPVSMAPEMWANGHGGVAADIYSVGVTLYRLLTGRWPYDAATPEEVASAALAADYPPLRDVAPHVSRRLADRVKRAMAVNPADRFSSTNVMHDALVDQGVVDRVWQRIDAHAGHDRCWEEQGDGSRRAHTVCVMAAGSSYDFETRRQTSARTRLKKYTGRAGSDKDLAVNLRRVFDSL
jgi:eukaryotic-like serine/threonine-protein kinase